MDLSKIHIVATDRGHNIKGVDWGAEGYLIESEVTKVVQEELNKCLVANGFKFVDVTPTSAKTLGDSLDYRRQVSDKSGADLLIVIHVNSLSNPSAHGVEVFADAAKDLSQVVADNLSKLGWTNRGVKDGGGLYLVAYPKAPTIYIELFFLSNRDDVELYKKVGPAAIAQTIVSALIPNGEVKPYIRVNQPIPNTDIAKIKDVQNTLNAMGFRDGSGFSLTVDGIWGPKSTYAMKLCQSVLNVPETGTYDNITIEAMKSILRKPLLQEGIKGVPVRFVQWKVGAVRDGDFGPMTKARVQNYQSENGLDADGIVGDLTWGVMIREIK